MDVSPFRLTAEHCVAIVHADQDVLMDDPSLLVEGQRVLIKRIDPYKEARFYSYVYSSGNWYLI